MRGTAAHGIDEELPPPQITPESLWLKSPQAGEENMAEYPER